MDGLNKWSRVKFDAKDIGGNERGNKSQEVADNETHIVDQRSIVFHMVLRLYHLVPNMTDVV